MQVLSKQQFLACQPNLSKTAYDKQAARGLIMLSFGQQHPFQRGQYLVTDLMAMLLVDEFAHRLGRPLAVELIRWTWPMWTDCLRRAEAERQYGCMVAVGQRTIRGGKSVLFFSGGTAAEIQADYAALPDAEKPPAAYTCDLWALVQHIRADADAAGVALDDPMVPDTAGVRAAIKAGQAIADSQLERITRGAPARPSPAQIAAFRSIAERAWVQ